MWDFRARIVAVLWVQLKPRAIYDKTKPMQLPLTPTPDQTLSSHETHLWLLDVASLAPEQWAKHLSALSDAERAKKMGSPQRQQMFLATRILLRRVLAHYSHLEPQELLFGQQESGKPFLTNANLHFNLSHSGQQALLAVSRTAEVGVDLELIRTRPNLMAISERYFHADEIAQLAALTATAQTAYFFKLWTLKEAFYKGLGSGIATGLDRTAFAVEGDKISARATTDSAIAIEDWQFYQTQLPQGYCAALAAKQTQPLTPLLYAADKILR